MATFKVSDLMINVVDKRLRRNGDGLAFCTIDQPTQDTCGLASPYMQVAKLSPRFQLVRNLAAQGTAEAVAASRAVAVEIGEVLAGGAALGGVGMPDPNCGGSSMETIPTPITPVASKADLLTPAELPAIRESLKAALEKVSELEAVRGVKDGVEKEVLREHLTKALKSLG